METDDDPLTFLEALFSKRPAKESVQIEEGDASIEDVLDCLVPSPKPLVECLVPTRLVTREDYEVYPIFGPRTSEFETFFEVNSVRGLFQSGPFSLLNLPNEFFEGCGVYGLFYHGELTMYLPVRSLGSDCPMYFGKCEKNLYERLTQHRESIEQVGNLKVRDFTYRFLPLHPIWIRSVEELLIKLFRPVWNKALEGFGNRHYGVDSRANLPSTNPPDLPLIEVPCL